MTRLPLEAESRKFLEDLVANRFEGSGLAAVELEWDDALRAMEARVKTAEIRIAELEEELRRERMNASGFESDAAHETLNAEEERARRMEAEALLDRLSPLVGGISVDRHFSKWEGKK